MSHEVSSLDELAQVDLHRVAVGASDSGATGRGHASVLVGDLEQLLGIAVTETHVLVANTRIYMQGAQRHRPHAVSFMAVDPDGNTILVDQHV